MKNSKGISEKIHKNCTIIQGHHFSRINPDFKCLVCGKDYVDWWLTSNIDLMEKCNGDEEYGCQDERKGAADEEPEDGSERTSGSEASNSNQDQRQEESTMTDAHDQKVSNTYTVHFPDHEPREDDPHYHAFNAYKRAHKATAKCYIGERVGFNECEGGLELHHSHLEFSLINEVDLAAMEKDYPNLTDPEKVAEWAETDANFMWLCSKHHRGVGGIHHASHSDFEASIYIKGLIS